MTARLLINRNYIRPPSPDISDDDLIARFKKTSCPLRLVSISKRKDAVFEGSLILSYDFERNVTYRVFALIPFDKLPLERDRDSRNYYYVFPSETIDEKLEFIFSEWVSVSEVQRKREESQRKREESRRKKDA